MRRAHFERFAPTCLACRARGDAPAPLAVGRVLREHDGDVIEGVLVCSVASCQREYPILDGIPILVLDVRGYLTAQLADVMARQDLSPTMSTLVGDAAGADSAYERSRYHLSIYGHGHWGDLDPDAPAERDSALVGLLERGLALAPEPPAGSWIDIGCSVGRGTFELAARTGALTLGVDMSFAMLRMARRILRTGRVDYVLRREGLVYEQRSYDTALAAVADKVDFWCCDATGLALPGDTFDGALSMNLLDCVASPLGHLIETGRVLAPGARAVLGTPFDWSSETPIEGWLGGHSQRSEHAGSSPTSLRYVLSDAVTGELAPALRIDAELEGAPWTVRTHARAAMRYRSHLFLLRRA